MPVWGRMSSLSPALPVTRKHLLDEGLSPPFVQYMNNWPGFVAQEETV